MQNQMCRAEAAGREKGGAALGVSGKTYEKAKAVVDEMDFSEPAGVSMERNYQPGGTLLPTGNENGPRSCR